MPIPQTSPASLDNTLQGADVQTQQDAMMQALQEALAQHTAEATRAAQQAGQQYQQAAGAPVPQPSPLDVLIPTLFGNVASVIGRKPEYAEQGQASVKQQRADLLKSRADNLQALRDTWEVKAQAAKQAGDLEAEQTALAKKEQLTKTLQQVLESQRHANAVALEDKRQANRLALKAAPGGGGVQQKIVDQSDPQAIAHAIEEGRMHPDTSKLGRLVGPVVASVLAKDGYNQAKALQTYNATAKHYGSLNGRLQLQIRQSANTVLQGLNDVEKLADQLYQIAPSSRMTPLNELIVKGSREWGALSPEAQDLATQLNGQVATLIPELANIYSAGGVPTDRAMKLSEQVINANWPPNRIKSGIARERANIQYRVNSINQVSAVTPESVEQGGYTPPSESPAPAPAAPQVEMVNVVGPNNQTGKVPKGTKLPKGWKLR